MRKVKQYRLVLFSRTPNQGMIVGGIRPGIKCKNLDAAVAYSGGVNNVIDTHGCDRLCLNGRRCACVNCCLRHAANVAQSKSIYACPLKVIYPLDNEFALSNFADMLHDYGKIPLRAAYPTELECQRLAASFFQ